MPGLLAWLDHAVGWEIDRRAGSVYPLLRPHVTIDESEIAPSRLRLAALVSCFRDARRANGVPVADFLELTAKVLSAAGQHPRMLH